MKPAISVSNLSKQYKLGSVHTDLLSEKLGNGLRAIGSRFRKGNGHSHTRALQKEDEHFWALKDINFEVQPGEVIGVIGRNGAGKSTLLKILSRITSPTNGEIKLQGQVASLLEVGTGFHPELTGRENIFLNGAILGMGRKEINEKFEEIVKFAGIEKFVDTPVKRYSSGMYVRLAFAVAAHLESDILVVDEVLAVGDAAFQRKCLNKMEDVAGEGRTVLFVSHNMTSIKRLCSKTILFEQGQLTAFADTRSVVQLYHQKNLEQRTSVTFTDSHHHTKSDFRILELTLIDASHQPLETIVSGVRFGMKVIVGSTCALENVYLAIEFHVDGLLLASFWVENISISKNETKSLICMLQDNMLKPGFYDAHMGATDISSGRPLDWIPDALSFQVVESAKGDHEHDKGLIKIPYSWAGDQSRPQS